MNEEEKAFDKVKKGFKEAGEGVKDVVGGTAQGVKEAVDDTAERAERVTDSDSYTANEDAGNRQYNESGGKEPMNPEDIASHEPTAVKRDKNQGTSGDPL